MWAILWAIGKTSLNAQREMLRGLMGKDIVLLDCSIVRSFLHGELPRLLDLRQYSDSISVSILDAQWSEILGALHEGRIGWESWVSGRDALAQIIDRDRPIRSLIEKPRLRRPEAEVQNTIHVLTTCWRVFLACSSLSEIASVKVNKLSGEPYTFELENIRSDIDAKVEYFAALYEDMWRDRAEAEAAGDHTAVGLTERSFATSLLGAFGQTEEAWVRTMASRFVSGIKRKGFNPRRPRRRGDAQDIKMLAALGLPAYVVTAERRLVNAFRQTQSVQSPQLLRLDEILDRLGAGTLDKLS